MVWRRLLLNPLDLERLIWAQDSVTSANIAVVNQSVLMHRKKLGTSGPFSFDLISPCIGV